jgi:ABC-type glycerol-3-phosphate transport system substrate-binding protein
MFKKSVTLALLVFFLLVACRAADKEEVTPEPTPTTAAVSEPVKEESLPPTPVAEEAVTISFAVFGFEQGRYNDVIAAFEEENPDIKINLRSIEEILDLNGLAAQWPEDARLRLASAADVSAVLYTPSAVDQGLLLDMGPLMTADTQFDSADFFPSLLSQYQSDGGTWAMPTEANYQLIFYNKDAFDQAGLPYPESGWSWDDFLATAQTLTLREGDEVSQWGFVEANPQPALFVQSLSGPLLRPVTCRRPRSLMPCVGIPISS